MKAKKSNRKIHHAHGQAQTTLERQVCAAQESSCLASRSPELEPQHLITRYSYGSLSSQLEAGQWTTVKVRVDSTQNHSEDKPLSVSVMRFLGQVTRGGKFHSHCGRRHSMGLRPGLNKKENGKGNQNTSIHLCLPADGGSNMFLLLSLLSHHALHPQTMSRISSPFLKLLL